MAAKRQRKSRSSGKKSAAENSIVPVQDQQPEPSNFRVAIMFEVDVEGLLENFLGQLFD